MRWIAILTCFGLLLGAEGSDTPCQNAGGTCQVDSTACSGHYQSGLCSGAANRRCCIHGSDASCQNAGGTCQVDSTACSGHYQSGLCSGAANRRCCIHSSDASCQNAGGTCQVDSTACSGHYQSGLCSGAANRRCCIGGPASGGYNCYGNFMNLHPTGASAQTARQDGITFGGVSASQQLVSHDINELNKLKNCYVQAGNNNCVHPAVIAGIASRESRGGAALASTGGWGDHHHAYGIMQCDGGASGLGSRCTQYPWNSCEHIDMMVRVLLVPFIRTIKTKHPNWTPEQQLQGGVSAYNAGTGNVQTWSGIDLGTTGNDYSNDVLARAQYLVNHYGW